jgi:hypothetical protein
MKKLLFLVLFSIAANADNSGTSGNNNNTITVNVKGCCAAKPCKPKTVTKVVEKIVEKPVIVPVEKIVYVDRVVEKKVEVKAKRKKNRVSLLAGVGPTRLDRYSETRVDLIRGPVGALQYQRLLNDTLSIGLQGQTNSTILGVVGLDF